MVHPPELNIPFEVYQCKSPDPTVFSHVDARCSPAADDDFAYILPTFPALQKTEECRYSEYRRPGTGGV